MALEEATRGMGGYIVVPRALTSEIACAIAAALLLAACGGGGGGSSTAPAGPSPAPTPGPVVSMIPQAPALGPVIATDAHVYRPLQAGSTWNYKGHDGSGGTHPPIRYTSSVSQAAGPNGATLETSSNLLEPNSGDDTTTVVLSGGFILVTQSFAPFGPSSRETFTSIELRSPVRQADQYTLLERTYLNTGLDVDGDMRQDAFDVAFYSRVIGEEDVFVADGNVMKALRVDTVFLTRFKRSSDGQYMPVSQALQSTWYARDFGPVRRTLTTPGVTGPNSVDVDERLATYDGVTTGYGYLPPQSALAAPNAGSGAGIPLGETVGVVAFENHGLVFTNLAFDPAGAAASVVDTRGAITSTQVYPSLISGVANATFSTNYVQVIRVGQGAGVLSAFANGAAFDLRLHVFDASGTLINGPNGVTISIGAAGTSVTAAFDGTRIWVLWRKQVFNPGPHTLLVMRAFDAQGLPVGVELVLEDPPIGAELLSPRIAADGGRAIVTWASLDFFGATFRYASTTGASLVAGMPLTLATVSGATAVSTGLRPALSTAGNGALLWHGSLLNSAQPDTAIRGVALDTNLQPLRSTQGSVDLEVLSASLVPAAGASDFLTAGSSDSIFIMRTNYEGKPYPDDPSIGYIEAARFAADSPLAIATPRRIRVPLQTVFSTSDPLRAVLAFTDRLIFFGGVQRTVVTPVWAVNN